MSNLALGFVSDSRFGAGQVIPATNRATSRKWRALGVPEAPAQLVAPGTCQACGTACCVCPSCTALFAGHCADCAAVPGWRKL